jgi:hypothetical protein
VRRFRRRPVVALELLTGARSRQRQYVVASNPAFDDSSNMRGPAIERGALLGCRPPPWAVAENDAYFIVRDEARRIAAEGNHQTIIMHLMSRGLVGQRVQALAAQPPSTNSWSPSSV